MKMQQPPSSTQKTQSPAMFLQKLRKILEDAATNADDIIKWNSTGDGFVIQDQAKFSFQILPKYYNHNNMCSFIRQLNMYGFHKVVLLETKKNRNQIEYTHRYFSKDEPDLMANIERKLPSAKIVLKDFEQIQGRHVEMDAKLEALQQENALLWREVAALRQKHLTQQQLVNKIIEFLVAVIQRNDCRGTKRRGGLLLDSPAAAATKKIGVDDESCGNGSAVVALLDNSMAVNGTSFDLQGDEEHGLDELSGIFNELNDNNLEAEVLDLDQLIEGIDGNLEAEQETSGEVVLDSSCSELLTEGPAYLDL